MRDPGEPGAPQWAPYAHSVLRVLKGDYGKFGRGRQEENLGKFETFFTMALNDINRVGPALVICEGDTLTHRLTALANGQLTFDQLTIANRTLKPGDLANLPGSYAPSSRPEAAAVPIITTPTTLGRAASSPGAG